MPIPTLLGKVHGWPPIQPLVAGNHFPQGLLRNFGHQVAEARYLLEPRAVDAEVVVLDKFIVEIRVDWAGAGNSGFGEKVAPRLENLVVFLVDG